MESDFAEVEVEKLLASMWEWGSRVLKGGGDHPLGIAVVTGAYEAV